jgi:hypothetical protein
VYDRDDLPHRPYRIQIFALQPDGIWLMAHDQTGKPFGGASGEPLKILTHDTPARAVRIQIPAREHLHLDEVEVYSMQPV